MKRFLTSNSTLCRLGRTVFQSICGVLIANLDALIGAMQIRTDMKPIIVALVMCVLSPVMAELGKSEAA